MIRFNAKGDTMESFCLSSRFEQVREGTDIEGTYETMVKEILKQYSDQWQKGLGWKLSEIERMGIPFVEDVREKGGSHFLLSKQT